MLKEKSILYFTWVLLVILLLWLVPNNMVREASVAFLFKQVMTWLFGLIVADKNLIEYPVRFFSKANKASFSFEFFAYPAICVFFNLYYPFGQSILNQLIHYVLYTSGITIFEVILEKHTNLIKYIKWKWYWTWVTVFVTFLASNLYYRWFFKI